jgi:hypothetical protein
MRPAKPRLMRSLDPGLSLSARAGVPHVYAIDSPMLRLDGRPPRRGGQKSMCKNAVHSRNNRRRTCYHKPANRGARSCKPRLSPP